MYRTHNCGELRDNDSGKNIKLSGWIHRKRDHGGLLFIDLRDHYGITQCIIDPNSNAFKIAEKLRNESIITIEGKVVKREDSVINLNMKTGKIEIQVKKISVIKEGIDLPLPVNSDAPYAQDIRLKYRFLDLRREKMHQNIVLRSKIIQKIRELMIAQGFLELQTPILTASSPEGARDYLVPSRHYPGKFYALPQAPQQFKQIYMVSGFDKYFQIAPCFRDEDARADRSPGEFYQLDVEMAFVTQEDVFSSIEPILYELFNEFKGNKIINKPPFPKIKYKEAINQFGTDKPDLRNPLRICDVTKIFKDSDFGIFKNAIKKGALVKGIFTPNIAQKPRSFFDNLNNWAKDNHMGGLAYILFGKNKGPIAKFLSDEKMQSLKDIILKNYDKKDLESGGIFFVCDEMIVYKLAGITRDEIANRCDLIDKNKFEFCWIVDFPMYEKNDDGEIDFSHNPFSMPQGGLSDLINKNPLDIKAFQYDIVCNGIELSSGAIRNHDPEIMYKAFEIAGYKKEDVDSKFKAMINAFKFGAPPHGGIAPGIDRIVMLLCEEENIREVIAFPMNQQAQDLMMESPCEVNLKHLKELHLQIKK